ncbi:MAG: hypothetical protein WC755_01590 [Candidatus Woesearchaeota archaeon]|jgi:hypothetical protein
MKKALTYFLTAAITIGSLFSTADAVQRRGHGGGGSSAKSIESRTSTPDILNNFTLKSTDYPKVEIKGNAKAVDVIQDSRDYFFPSTNMDGTVLAFSYYRDNMQKAGVAKVPSLDKILDISDLDTVNYFSDDSNKAIWNTPNSKGVKRDTTTMPDTAKSNIVKSKGVKPDTTKVTIEKPTLLTLNDAKLITGDYIGYVTPLYVNTTERSPLNQDEVIRPILTGNSLFSIILDRNDNNIFYIQRIKVDLVSGMLLGMAKMKDKSYDVVEIAASGVDDGNIKAVAIYKKDKTSHTKKDVLFMKSQPPITLELDLSEVLKGKTPGIDTAQKFSPFVSHSGDYLGFMMHGDYYIFTEDAFLNCKNAIGHKPTYVRLTNITNDRHPHASLTSSLDDSLYAYTQKEDNNKWSVWVVDTKNKTRKQVTNPNVESVEKCVLDLNKKYLYYLSTKNKDTKRKEKYDCVVRDLNSDTSYTIPTENSFVDISVSGDGKSVFLTESYDVALQRKTDSRTRIVRLNVPKMFLYEQYVQNKVHEKQMYELRQLQLQREADSLKQYEQKNKHCPLMFWK